AFIVQVLPIIHLWDLELFPSDVPLPPKDVIEKALLATREAAASNALFAVAALVGALMVQSLSKQQTRRAREIERSGPPVAAAWGVAPPGWPGQQPAGWGPSPGHLAPWGPPA